MTSHHPHLHHWHLPEIPASFALMGAVLGIIVIPVSILALLFFIARSLSGLP